LLYEDETIVWRFALPRLGWWRRAQRYRLPTRPLSQGQIKQQESHKRQTWVQYRSWSRITRGVLLSVIGAVQYGTSKIFYKIVPHFDAQELRQYCHQVMATFSKTGKEVVMVVDRSGIHRAHKLDATLDHYQGKLRFHFLPAHCGHHLNPIFTPFAPEYLERYPNLPWRIARSSAPSKTVKAATTDTAAISAQTVGGTTASIIPVATATVPVSTA
jgi:hypothetical protein